MAQRRKKTKYSRRNPKMVGRMESPTWLSWRCVDTGALPWMRPHQWGFLHALVNSADAFLKLIYFTFIIITAAREESLNKYVKPSQGSLLVFYILYPSVKKEDNLACLAWNGRVTYCVWVLPGPLHRAWHHQADVHTLKIAGDFSPIKVSCIRSILTLARGY